MKSYKHTRLRYVASPSPEGLEAVINRLGFKVEIKALYKDGVNHICWFVIPDNVTQEHFETMSDLEAKSVNVKSGVMDAL